MIVLRHHGGGGGGFLAGKQVVPVNYEAEVSQRLLEASLCNDLRSTIECISDPFVDVNHVGAVCLKIRKTDVVLREESPSEVVFDYEEFRTDVTALFVAVTNGHVALTRKLLTRIWGELQQWRPAVQLPNHYSFISSQRHVLHHLLSFSSQIIPLLQFFDEANMWRILRWRANMWRKLETNGNSYQIC